MTSQELQKYDLPDCPGVYFFYGAKGEILYVGKATSLKDRVKSYFQTAQVLKSRGERIVEMVELAASVEWKTADSVLEALLLEANEIHSHQPPYNTLGKDDKSFNYVIVTKEDFPRILVMRGRELEMAETLELENQVKIDASYGPFPHGGELRAALKIIRRIFPYRDTCTPAPKQRDPEHPKACWNAQIGQCPGVCAGWMDKKEYRKQVRRIKAFFEGKKAELAKSIERDMKDCAKQEMFEEAEKLKRMLYAMEHIQDVALIKRDIERSVGSDVFRIEAYDIAHLGGSDTVGVMTVVEDGELAKSQYRKFRIRGKNVEKLLRNSAKASPRTPRTVDIDDTANLKEVLRRRFGHPEWTFPSMIAIDGGVAQLNAANEVVNELGLSAHVVSILKDNKHKAKEILGNPELAKAWEKSILLANVEAHRFAITYHRKLRGKGFRI